MNMLVDFIAWAFAIIVSIRFLADHVVFPVVATAMELKRSEQPEELEHEEAETYQIGFKYDPDDD
jgi:hypothetical protein